MPSTASPPMVVTRTGSSSEPTASAMVSTMTIAPTARPRTASVVTRWSSVVSITSRIRWPAEISTIAAIAARSAAARPRTSDPTATTTAPASSGAARLRRSTRSAETIAPMTPPMPMAALR